MRIIRVSEISSYLYCKRSWWYLRQGIQSENQTELAAGTDMHRRHGRLVAVNGCLRILAYGLLLLALLFLTVYAVGKIA